MDSTTFKPYTYDPQFFIDKQAATAATLSAAGVNDVSELPLLSFHNYTAAEENLNQITQQTGVTNFIGNQLVYISAGDTTGSYTTGVLTTPTDPQRNLLNRYHPTVNFKANQTRLTREQIGGHLLPHRVAVLNYISMQPRFRVLTERLEPGKTYIVADPTIYGSGQGNNNLLTRDLPIDHDEDVTWIKSPPVYAAQSGRITNADKQANFYNYTSTEQTLGAPKFGVCKFTDNFDFFAGSVSGDMWANEDIYKLTEANKYDIVNRQRDLLTDICDSPYRWRTDIYGNEYMFYKLGTQALKRTAGGSDTDGDGRDDQLNPGLGISDYYHQDINQEGVFIDSNTSVTFGGGASQDGGIFAPTNPGDTTPGIGDSNPIYVDSTSTQLPLASCFFFLYGGESLSPLNSSTNLDMTYRFQTVNTQASNAYTVAGGVSAIVDGGWRTQHDQTLTGDQYTNQFEQTSATPIANVVNGFFDQTHYASVSASFNRNTSEVSWLPDWTLNTVDQRRFPTIRDDDTDISYTFTYSNDVNDTANNRRVHDRAYVYTQPQAQRRSENYQDFRYVIADGGWYSLSRPEKTFFRTQCDRASYILARYGFAGVPDFGNHIFACKMFEITGQPDTYLNVNIRDSVYNGDDIRYRADVAYARQRGPLNATSFRNPIEWSAGIEQKFSRNIQFFGTVDQLQEWKAAIRLSGTSRAGLHRLPVNAFDYLTLGEYYHMRVSTIEGTGTKINNVQTFLDTDTSAPGTQTDGRPRYLGTPDIFYYVNGGNVQYQDQNNTLTTTYAAVSGEVSYVYSSVKNISLYDIGDIPATQFPQVRHVAYNRSYNVSVEDYNDSTCYNVSEYRIYTGPGVVDDHLENAAPIVDWTIGNWHPVAEFRGQTFKSKRGYFPPPVGHLRRSRKFPVAASPSLVGKDEPIPHNFLPDTSTPELSGFYVHDVWDGAGFIFQAGADSTSVTQEAPVGNTSKEPQLGENNLTTLTYTPQTDTVVTITGGLVANLGCGGYTGYFNVTSVAPSPVLNDIDGPVDVPLGSVAQMVKRASDTAEDMCYVALTSTPTLWEQKHAVTQIAPTNITNVVIRNLYSDSIVVLSEILAPLAAQFADTAILTPSAGFIDMDVIHDTLILRQSNTNDTQQSYIFDQIKFDYTTGAIVLGERSTHSLTTQPTENSSLLCHYFNEDDNCLIVGYTHVESQQLMYPVMYKLDLTTHAWTEIYSGSTQIDEFQLTSASFGGINCEITDVDPGEITYNPVTNNYCITYFAQATVVDQPERTSLVIFNHVFENLDSQLKLISANMYHSQNKTTTTQAENITRDTVALRLTESGVRASGESVQLPISLSTSSSKYDLTIGTGANRNGLDGTVDTNPIDSSVRPVQMHIDWGDGETSTIYSDYDISTQLRRYGSPGNRVKVSENTVLETPPSYNGTSLSQHKLTHTYNFHETGSTTITITCYMNDQSTTYSNTITIDHFASDISETFNSVKLINTKLYSNTDTSKQQLLLTIETQNPRHIANNIIQINT